MLKTFVLNIDNELFLLESIFNKYIPHQVGAMFIMSRRYPVVNPGGERPSSTPYYPYKSVEFVCKCILHEIYKDTIYNDIFANNKTLKVNRPKIFYNYYEVMDDILDRYIKSTYMDPDDVYAILDLASEAIFKVNRLIGFDNNSILGFNIETKHIILNKSIDISTFRYLEKLEEDDEDIFNYESKPLVVEYQKILKNIRNYIAT